MFSPCALQTSVCGCRCQDWNLVDKSCEQLTILLDAPVAQWQSRNMRKRCTRCKRVKNVSSFHKRSRASDGLSARCKKCHAAVCAELFRSNRTGTRDQIYRNRKRHRKLAQEVAFQYLLSHPCVDCGESDPAVLDFDHRDGEEKLNDVAKLLGNCASVKAVAREIAKCDIRCANCHRRKTAKNRQWYRFLRQTAPVA
jgi:hypothetical protein